MDHLQDSGRLLLSELMKGMYSNSKFFKNGRQMVGKIKGVKSKNR
ncbi:MAG: hypothetical protein ACJAX7_002500 [Saprospiraceae bacterium]|jgi:hypothetical protein